ncbi:4Fe-4S binding domain protein [bacterium BMS3Abin01]|nr:4Fe-4S binding domain protein [bacterium BMS3Abin01]
MNGIVDTIKNVLKETDLVLGWTTDPVTGVATPARFHDEKEAEQAVFDSTCAHNLAVHLPRLKDSRVGIVAKGCDARSVIELIIEHEVQREQLAVIGVGCGSLLDVKKIWRRYGYGVAIKDRDDSLLIGGEQVNRDEFIQRKCHGCLEADPDIYDVIAGEVTGEIPTDTVRPHPLHDMFVSLTPAERRSFWREQFSRCIRCYACREVCPMCFCRDVCIMQTQIPRWAGGAVDAKQSEMIQLIRVNHLAGRCTGCGECERACPVGIPLMLLLDEQNHAIEEMFAYGAGASLKARPPLLVFDVNKDIWGKG